MEIQIKKFRQLSLDELYEILKLRVDVFVVEQKCAYPELDNKDQHANHLIVSNGNQVVGYLRIYYTDPTRAAIGRVLTLESFRGQGLSRKMMEEALSFLQDKSKIETIYLQAQEHLSNFYASFGFEKTSDVYLDDGIPHVDMEKIVKTEE